MTIYTVGTGNYVSGGVAVIAGVSHTLASGDTVSVTNGGFISATTLTSGITVSVMNGGTESGVTVLSGSVDSVFSGGTASATTVSSGGTITVSGTGATETGTTVHSGGDDAVASGAVATSAIVLNGGVQKVGRYATTLNTSVMAGGVQSGLVNAASAVMSNTSVFAGGLAKVGSKTLLTGAVIYAGGSLFVSSGGTVSGTTVDTGAVLTLLAGANFNSSPLTDTVQTGVTSITTQVSPVGVVTTAMAALTSGQYVGSVTVSGGGTITVGSGALALSSTVNSGGSQIVSAGGTTLDTVVNSSGIETVGGTAIAVTVNNGGTQNVSGGTASATTINSGGAVNVFSGGSVVSNTVNSSGTQTVGAGGTATATTINNGGLETVASSGTATSAVVSSGGVQNVSGGTASATTINSGGTVNVSAGGSVVSNNVNNGGIQTIGAGGTAGYTIVNSGGLESITSGGTATSTTVNSSGVQSVGANGSAVGTIVNSGGTEVVASGGVISGTVISGGGALDLKQFASGAGLSATINSSDLLTVTSGAVSATYQLSGTYTTGPVVFGNDGSGFADLFVCYMGGTQILTPHGEVPVETIKAGQDVIVRRDGQDVQEPVVWVGTSKVDLTRHAQPELAAPIRVKAGALADNVPTRDLLLSPEHSLILNGRCVPVKLLVNGASIAREYPAEPFEYVHIELAKHGILIAEGAESESYLDTGNRMLFDNAGVPSSLHKLFAVNAESERWATDACAPLATETREIAPIWQALADRSATLGFVVAAPDMVESADLHILADGKRIQPISDRDSRYVFTVPAGTQSVSLASRFCIPADKMLAEVRDLRRLGVSVNWIAIRSGHEETILSADHPALRNGWNASEQDGATMWRWTDGAATIPWGNVTEAAVLTVRCIPAGQYPVQDAKLAMVA